MPGALPRSSALLFHRRWQRCISIAPGVRPAFGRAATGPGMLKYLQRLPDNKRKTGDEAAQGGTAKKAHTGISRSAADGDAAPCLLTASGNVPDEAVQSAAYLSHEEAQQAAERAMAVAAVRVEQAAAAGAPPQLEHLLVDASWAAALSTELRKPYFGRLAAFLEGEWRAGQVTFPAPQHIFRAFNTCPLERARVVLLGQDPYHGPGQACGLCFSVPQGAPVPSSLRNMYRELQTDLGCAPPRHGNLEQWAAEGVFMLNACLTVRAGAAASHSKKGWEQFTDAAILALSERRKGLVFLLWGRYAQQKELLIDRTRHHVLKAAHPSGLSANKGFFGCKHFSKANRLLEKEGLPPITWCIK